MDRQGELLTTGRKPPKLSSIPTAAPRTFELARPPGRWAVLLGHRPTCMPAVPLRYGCFSSSCNVPIHFPWSVAWRRYRLPRPVRDGRCCWWEAAGAGNSLRPGRKAAGVTSSSGQTSLSLSSPLCPPPARPFGTVGSLESGAKPPVASFALTSRPVPLRGPDARHRGDLLPEYEAMVPGGK